MKVYKPLYDTGVVIMLEPFIQKGRVYAPQLYAVVFVLPPELRVLFWLKFNNYIQKPCFKGLHVKLAL